jgi:hypothetical protein
MEWLNCVEQRDLELVASRCITKLSINLPVNYVINDLRKLTNKLKKHYICEIAFLYATRGKTTGSAGRTGIRWNHQLCDESCN